MMPDLPQDDKPGIEPGYLPYSSGWRLYGVLCLFILTLVTLFGIAVYTVMSSKLSSQADQIASKQTTQDDKLKHLRDRFDNGEFGQLVVNKITTDELVFSTAENQAKFLASLNLGDLQKAASNISFGNKLPGILGGLKGCGACVSLQSQSPGVPQLGHMSIAGTGYFGSGVATAGKVQATGNIETEGKLRAAGDAYIGGNFGVGTETPIAQLEVAGKLSAEPIVSVGTGLRPMAVQVVGKYAYLVAADSNQLQIFNVSNPDQPALVSSTTTQDLPVSLQVSGRYAYVTSANGAKLEVIDVSNPNSPVQKGSVDLDGGPSLVSVQGRYAYVSIMGNGRIQIVDLADPAKLVIASTLVTGTTPIGLTVKGRYLYLSDSGESKLQIIDVINPAAPVIVGSVATELEPYPPTIEGSYAYVPVTNSANFGFQVIRVSNPASPTIVKTVSTPDAPVKVTILGRFAYVLMPLWGQLYVYDISDPANPVYKSAIGASGNKTGVSVVGRYAYLLNSDTNMLEVYDVSGAYIQNLQTSGIETGSLEIHHDLNVGEQANLTGGAVIAGGLQVQGSASFENGGYFGQNVIIRAMSGQTADLLQAQDSAGTILAKLDKDGHLSVKNITVGGHLITTGSTPSVSVGTDAGSGANVAIAGNDTSGTITITTGAGPSSGELAIVDFAAVFGAAPKVMISPANAAAGTLQYYQGATTTGQFKLQSGNAPTGATVYIYNYLVVQ